MQIEGLIETWDVLKYDGKVIGCKQEESLIETWDVLKFDQKIDIRCAAKV